MPRDVDWHGRVVLTGAWKAPVEGPTMVRRTNLDGDGQGDLSGHGGEIRAVLVYQLDSYRHWARELERDDLSPGAFGENLTVDGLPDHEVCIGDRYRIGDVVLEVTQPRVTCYRVGLRLDEPRMAALLVGHHRPGFYCRVIEEGEVAAGLEMVKVADGPEQVTVAEMDALRYLPGHARDRLESALRIPALSPGWKASLQSLLEHDGDTSAIGNSGLIDASANPPAWQGFRPLHVVDVHRESASVTSFSLADGDGETLPPRLAGQAIAVRLAVPGSAPAAQRPQPEERPFADEVASLLSRLPGSRSAVFYSRDGRLDAQKLQALAPPLDADAYLCGPTAFMADLRADLASYGLAPNRIHSETFGTQSGINPGVVGSSMASPHPPPGAAGSGPEVQFARAGVSAPWSAEYASLLEFAEACDVPTRWSCRTGVCHTCETPMLAGSVTYPFDPLELPADGNALLCIATPSEQLVLDL